MTQGTNDKSALSDLERAAEHHAHFQFSERLQRIAQFEAISVVLRELSLLYHGCVIEAKNPSQPQFNSLTPQDWQTASSQFEDVIQSLQGLHYHASNILRIEKGLDHLIQRFQGRTRAVANDEGLYWSGLTNKMTFEFQAYASLVHRHLVYLAWLLGTLLGGGGVKCPNLKSAKKLLKSKTGNSMADLSRVLRAHGEWLESLYDTGTPRQICLRNELAHESFVPAGGFHIHDMKAHIKGKIAPGMNKVETEFRVYRLGDEMLCQMGRLEHFLLDILRSLDAGFVPRADDRKHMRKHAGSESGEFGSIPL